MIEVGLVVTGRSCSSNWAAGFTISLLWGTVTFQAPFKEPTVGTLVVVGPKSDFVDMVGGGVSKTNVVWVAIICEPPRESPHVFHRESDADQSSCASLRSGSNSGCRPCGLT